MPRGVAYGLGGLFLVAALVLTLAYVFQRRLIYLPSSGPVPPAASVLPGAREVSFQTSDGLRLAGWFVPADAPDLGVTVLVAPGNAGDRSLRAPLARALRASGLSVLLMDYRGYGGNPGDPTEAGLALDVRAARRLLVDELHVAPNRLLYYGESLGAAVVTELAVEHPPGGLLLRSPFVDLASVGREHYPILPVRTLLKDRFPVLDNIKRVRAPTTVVYGSADSIVPAAQSRVVAAAASATVVEVARADHNDRSLQDGAELIGAVVELAGRFGVGGGG
jgi:fermentation-respiration switch protein FrsA (DUF1100 family)